MKKYFVFAVALILVLALASFSYAKYVFGYKVVEVSEDQVIIQRGNGDPITVTVKKGKYKVGDKVKYDAEKAKLKPVEISKPFEGC